LCLFQNEPGHSHGRKPCKKYHIRYNAFDNNNFSKVMVEEKVVA